MFFCLLSSLYLYTVDVVFHILQQLYQLAESVRFCTLLLLLQKAVILDIFDYYFNQQWTLLAICFPELWMLFSTCHHCYFNK